MWGLFMLRINLEQNYYYNDLLEDSKSLQKKYRNILEVENIGTSHDNREILLFRIGKGEKGVLLTGGVHGRESINPIVLMKMVEDYCITGIDQYSIYVIPLLNPDGYMIALRGFNIITKEELRLEAKKQGIPYFFWKYNARGIDLNRNFPSKNWKAKYEGDTPASEKETVALMEVMQSISTVGYIDYHSRGKEIYYYRNQMSQKYNKRQFEIASKIKELTNYSLVSKSLEIDSGDTGGNTVHYYSEYIRKPAITVETVAEEYAFPLPISLQRETYEEIWETPFVLLEKV